MAKTIVILGGSYAGVHIAHYLLKQKNLDVKVILVSISSHFYWNMASVRAIVPNQLTDEQLFTPLSTAFARYPSTAVEVIVGTASKVDATARTVLISVSGATDDRTLTYDQLVLATGSRSTDTTVPWKNLSSYDETVALLDATRARVRAAQRIVVAGAGATGIEVAGELGCEYGKAKAVTLLCSGGALMGGDSVGAAARGELAKLGVQVKTEARVAGVKELPDGTTEVSLASGETVVADLYLPTMGMKANSEMVDGKYLNAQGYVVVDEFYRVKGLESEGVWALGDVVSKPRGGFLITQKQAAGVAKNIDLALHGKGPQTVKLMPVDIVACAIGRSRGVGRMGPVKMPSHMVWVAKGRTLGIQRLPGYIDGSVA